MKKIGLFGYGTVGQGLVSALRQQDQLEVELVKICIKNADKTRDLPTSLFTTHPDDLLLDPEIDLIVELTDDSEAAFHLVETALKQNKAVVSANKKMIADHMEIIAKWHQQYEAPFLYEGAVAGAIPIIQNLKQFFGHQKVTSLRGILNGSTNYILSQMRTQNLSYEQALLLAQEKGFAESDPSLDISGTDALYKLIILGYHAFGLQIDPEQVRVESITNMEDHFYQLAAQRGLKIKSIASIYESNGTYRFKVQPELIGPGDDLFGIENEDNAIVIEGNISGKHSFTGKGAGSLPTAYAVLNDIHLILTGFRYQDRLHVPHFRKSA